MKLINIVFLLATVAVIANGEQQVISPLQGYTMSPADLVTPAFDYSASQYQQPSPLSYVTTSTIMGESQTPQIIEQQHVQAEAQAVDHLDRPIIMTSCGCINQPNCGCAPSSPIVRTTCGCINEPNCGCAPSLPVVSTPCGCISQPNCGCAARTPVVMTSACGCMSLPICPCRDSAGGNKTVSSTLSRNVKRIQILQRQLRRIMGREMKNIASSSSTEVKQDANKFLNVLKAIKKVENKAKKNAKMYKKSNGKQGKESFEKDVHADEKLQIAAGRIFNKTREAVEKITGVPPNITSSVKRVAFALDAMSVLNGRLEEIIKERNKQAPSRPSKMNHELRIFTDLHEFLRRTQERSITFLLKKEANNDDLKDILLDIKKLVDDQKAAGEKAKVDRATLKVAENRMLKMENSHQNMQQQELTEMKKLQQMVQNSSDVKDDVKKTAEKMPSLIKAEIHETSEKKKAIEKRMGKEPPKEDKQKPAEEVAAASIVKQRMDKDIIAQLENLKNVVTSETVKGEIGSIMKLFKKQKKLEKSTQKDEKKEEKGGQNAEANLDRDAMADSAMLKEAKESIARLEISLKHSLETNKQLEPLLASIKQTVGIIQQENIDEKKGLEQREGKPKDPTMETRNEQVKGAIKVDAVLQNAIVTDLSKIATAKDEKVKQQVAKVEQLVKQDLRVHGQERAAEKREEIGERLMESSRAKDKGAVKNMRKLVKKLERKINREAGDNGKGKKLGAKTRKAITDLKDIVEGELYVDHEIHILMNAKDGKINTRQFLRNLVGKGKYNGMNGDNKFSSTTLSTIPMPVAVVSTCGTLSTC